MSRSILMSLLVRQHLALKGGFTRRYPHGFMVWEAGAWNVTDTGEQNIATTRLPVSELKDCLPTGDVLCFELAPSQRKHELKVGRASVNDLVLNDATVSREHLVLLHRAERWYVKVLSTNKAQLNGKTLPTGDGTVLQNADKLTLGEVNLTYYDVEGFQRRIAAEQVKLLQAVADSSRKRSVA